MFPQACSYNTKRLHEYLMKRLWFMYLHPGAFFICLISTSLIDFKQRGVSIIGGENAGR